MSRCSPAAGSPGRLYVEVRTHATSRKVIGGRHEPVSARRHARGLGERRPEMQGTVV